MKTQNKQTSDSHLESIIKFNKDKVIEFIYDHTHWWDGDYYFYQHQDLL